MTSSTRAPYQTWNAQLRIALAVLDDGKARDIGNIFAEAPARGLARPGTKSQTMYASLERYIIHTRALGRRPLIVLDHIGTFASTSRRTTGRIPCCRCVCPFRTLRTRRAPSSHRKKRGFQSV
jgi:hypothetical protein